MSPLKHSQSLAARMGRWSAAHRKTAIFGWLAFVIVSFALGAMAGTKQIDQNDANVGESRTADRIIDDAGFTVDENGATVEEVSEMVLVQSKTLDVKDPAFRAAVRDAEQTLATHPEVTELRSPLGAGSAGLVSKDRHSVVIQYTPKGTHDEAVLYIDKLVAVADKVQSRHAGVTVESVGLSTDKAVDAEIQSGLGKAGMISIPLTIIILMFVLGSLVAAFVPLLISLSAIAATFGLVGVASQAIPASENIMEVVLLVGLAVGVDYALFYMRREREERAAGRSEGAALEAAAATSGHAVLVSGITVLIAMAGMFLSGDKEFMSFSVGTMLVVAVAMLGSLTVLPAVLAWLGDRAYKGRIPGTGPRQAGGGQLWGTIVDGVLRRPLVSAVTATALLLALAAPTLVLHTTQTGIEGISTPAVAPFTKLIDAFPGTPEPAVVAIKAKDANSPELQAAIADLKTQALASGQIHAPVDVEINRAGSAARIEMPLVGDGIDDRSNAALATLRGELIPQTVGKVAGAQVAVTGMTANSLDITESQTSSIPLVFGFVLLFAFGLLLAAFRSIVIALKAIVLNLLSVGAAYGVLVAVFQWGWGESLLGFTANGGIANWLPMFMFVILFGLSMDYHVFILSRIREAHDRGLSTDRAIAHGIKATAGTVTSAAVVMVGVFSVFVMLPLVDLKEMGLGLAAAVLIDATIVRGVLLPATMKLLGDANWYLPQWLQWLPRQEPEAPVGYGIPAPVPVAS